MGPFPTSDGYEYILMTEDYLSRCVEGIPTRTNDHKIVKFIQQNIFSKFGCLRKNFSDGGMHFNNYQFYSLLKELLGSEARKALQNINQNNNCNKRC